MWGGSPGQHFVQYRAQRVDIAAGVELSVARCLLGAHVLWRAEREPGLGESVPACFPHSECNAEVRQHRLALVEQNILRLQVPMNYPMLVGMLQRTRHLLRDRQGFVYAELLLPLQFLAERLTSDEGNDVPEEAVALAGVDEGEDVRMIEFGGEVDLGEKPSPAQHGGQLRAEHLERDVAVVLEVVGQVDRGHAALAELVVEPVAVLKGGGQARRTQVPQDRLWRR